MRKGDQKIFKDKEKLYEMVNLRINGYALTSLATLFNCHISSLEYQFEKYQINPPEQVFTIERIILQALPHDIDPIWKVVNGQRYNLGRNYKDYLNR